MSLQIINNFMATKKTPKPRAVFTPDPYIIREIQSKARARKAANMRAFSKAIKYIVLGIIALTVLVTVALQPYTIIYTGGHDLPVVGEDMPVPKIEVQSAEAAEVAQVYHVTGYNTVPEQTDDTPCIAASGADICGRTDVIACPRAIPLGTRAIIDGREYVCEDRLAKKYDHRIDISCDKDTTCPARVTGRKEVVFLR